MHNILAAVTSAMKNLLDDTPKPPLHIGEVLACWTYLAALEEAYAFEAASLNTTKDEELLVILRQAQDICHSHIRHVRDFMLQEGVPLPTASEAKPRSESDAIPLGVKATDDEIANGLGLKAAGAIVHCAFSLSQSVRTDVGIMWTRFQAEQMMYASSLKTLMAKRNWLKIPPYYNPPGRPQS